MKQQQPISLKPDYSGRVSAGDHLIRGILGAARNLVENRGEGAAAIVERDFPDGVRGTLALLNRATTVPATTTTAGWAAELATEAITDLVILSGGLSAFGDIARLKSPLLNFRTGNSIALTTLTPVSTNIGFVPQAGSIPIRSMLFGGPTITPKKMAVGLALTRETTVGSNAEQLVKQALVETLGLAIDSKFFDAVAGDAIRSAGILNGVVATVATAGGGENAMVSDLANLAAAVAPVGGQNIVFIASPAEATKIQLRSSQMPFPVLSSSALAAGTVVALAFPALGLALDEPRFSVSTEAVYHSDDAPIAISTPGSPATVASPVRSLFQTDTIGIIFICDLSWALRVSTGAVALVQSVTW